MALIAFLEESGIEFLVSPRMTGEWEQKLLRMEKGDYGRNAFMSEIAEMSTMIVNIIRDKAQGLPTAAATQLTAPCPKCSGAVSLNGRAYECAGCSFRLWSEVAGRRLSEDEVETLLREGKTEVLTGFTSSRTGKKFSAALRLDAETGKTEFVFEDKAPAGGAAPAGDKAPADAKGAARLTAPCPKCKAAIEVKGKVYACTGCDFKVWSEIASRKLSAGEAETLIGKGQTGLLSGFKSGAGRKFSAKLKLNRETWKVDFEFEPRK
jgi:DNA topoisomerase-3